MFKNLFKNKFTINKIKEPTQKSRSVPEFQWYKKLVFKIYGKQKSCTTAKNQNCSKTSSRP